jgi:hypothetical protein
MKTKKIFLIALLGVNLVTQKLFAQQPQLTVTQLAGFPALPADTAKEVNQYNFIISVSNLSAGAVQVNDTMRVFLKNTDTTIATIETLGSVFIDSLVGLDTFSITKNNYQFTSNTYKTGNNIVVVWPRIDSIPGATFDSLYIDVYFVPLLSVNMLSEQNQSFFLFPNPVTDEIMLDSDHQNSIGYVRISNDLGQTVMFRSSVGKNLDVRFLSKGFYFIEITERNGIVSRKKFLKL